MIFASRVFGTFLFAYQNRFLPVNYFRLRRIADFGGASGEIVKAVLAVYGVRGGISTAFVVDLPQVAGPGLFFLPGLAIVLKLLIDLHSIALKGDSQARPGGSEAYAPPDQV